MSGRMAALGVMCVTLAAPVLAAARLPEAAVRAFEGIDADHLLSYGTPRITRRAAWIAADGPEPSMKKG